MSDTIIIRRNGEKFAVDCSTVLEAFNGHLKVKFDGIICPKCGASDSCWIPVRKVEDDGDRTVKLYEACYEMLRYYYEQNTNTTVFNTALELMKQAVAEAAGESEVKDDA